MRIALVHENSPGLRHDVRVLRAVLDEISQASLELVEICLDWSESHHRAEAAEDLPGLRAPFDLVIFFEITNNHPIFLNARVKILLPNPECLDPRFLDVARQCDVIWHKTIFSKVRLESLLSASAHRIIGFTSEPPHVKAALNNRFLHVKGARSTRRNTDAIVRCWLQNPELPPLSILCHEPLPGIPKRLPRNLRICQGWLSPNRFRRLYGDHGIHLCLSECEGFGHYINEARAAGALVLATDAPPMNELIDFCSGVLVEADSGKPFNYGMIYSVSDQAVLRAANAAIALSATERNRMVALSQCMYWRDRHRFIGQLLTEVGGWLGR